MSEDIKAQMLLIPSKINTAKKEFLDYIRSPEFANQPTIREADYNTSSTVSKVNCVKALRDNVVFRLNFIARCNSESWNLPPAPALIEKMLPKPCGPETMSSRLHHALSEAIKYLEMDVLLWIEEEEDYINYWIEASRETFNDIQETMDGWPFHIAWHMILYHRKLLDKLERSEDVLGQIQRIERLKRWPEYPIVIAKVERRVWSLMNSMKFAGLRLARQRQITEFFRVEREDEAVNEEEDGDDPNYEVTFSRASRWFI